MNQRSSSKSSLLLMELVLAILLFSITSAYCVQIFSKAHSISIHTENLNFASNYAQSAIAAVSGTNGNLTALQHLFPDSEINGDSLLVYYDSEWASCTKSHSVFIMTVTISEEETMQTASIVVETEEGSSADSIYDLSYSRHLPNILPEDSLQNNSEEQVTETSGGNADE